MALRRTDIHFSDYKITHEQFEQFNDVQHRMFL